MLSVEPLLRNDDLIRAQSKIVKNPNGVSYRVINVGVPREHQLADLSSRAGSSDLFNLKIGPIKLPVAPTFMIKLGKNAQANQRESSTALSPAQGSSTNPTMELGSDGSIAEIALVENLVDTMVI